MALFPIKKIARRDSLFQKREAEGAPWMSRVRGRDPGLSVRGDALPHTMGTLEK